MSSPDSFHSLDGVQHQQRLIRVAETYRDGDRYEGTVVINEAGSKVKHGRGRYVFRNGSIYDGEWKNGAMHGKGCFSESTTGDRYNGTWAQGRRVCGVYYFSNGDLYVGGFDASGHRKEGRCVVVEGGEVFDAVYHLDKEVRREAFDTQPARAQAPSRRPGGADFVLRASASALSAHSAAVATATEDDQYEAAKVVLQAKRRLPETNVPHGRRFGNLQHGNVERFAHVSVNNSDAKDAYRFHYI